MPLKSNMNIGIAIGLALIVGYGLYMLTSEQPKASPYGATDQQPNSEPTMDADVFETSDPLNRDQSNTNEHPASQLKKQEIKIIASLLAKELRSEDGAIQFENESDRHQSQIDRLIEIESFFQSAIKQYDETYITPSHISDGLKSILDAFMRVERENNAHVISGDMTVEKRDLASKEALVKVLEDMVDLLGVVGVNDFKETVRDYNLTMEKPLFNNQ